MALILTILSALASTGATLTMLVFLIAGAPNSSARQLAQLKTLAILVAAFWLAGLAGATWAYFGRRDALAAGFGIVPAIFCIALFAWLFASSG